MVSVTLSHVIGTTALISIFIVTGIFYSISYSSFENQVIATHLEEVANHISSNVIDLVSLCLLNNQDQLIVEEINVPEHINNHYYGITILQVKDPNTQEWLFTVRTYLNSKTTIHGESHIPWSAEGNLYLYNGTNSPEISHPPFQPKVNVTSDTTNIVTWCSRAGEKITIGLGVGEGV